MHNKLTIKNSIKLKRICWKLVNLLCLISNMQWFIKFKLQSEQTAVIYRHNGTLCCDSSDCGCYEMTTSINDLRCYFSDMGH